MTALVLIDLIHDMVGEGGKLSGKGYGAFANSRRTSVSVASWRADPEIELVVHVGLRFRSDYADGPRESVLLGKVAEFNVASGDGAEFVPWAQPVDGDIVISKTRVSPFFGTNLDSILRSRGVGSVVIGGVATDLAVSSAVRDAHDLGYRVRVAQDACVAASDADHDAALLHLSKLATIVDVE